jgi:hypothetical protein
MDYKERLQRQMIGARQTSERLLADFHAPEDWTRQVHPNCNHALWFAGHMAQSDNFFISLIAPQKAVEMPVYAKLFGVGSQPTGNPDDYPPVEEVLASMRERRSVLLALLNGMSEDELAQPTPKGSPDFLKDVASVFETSIWHEGMHSGQLSVTRRALGFSPIMA